MQHSLSLGKQRLECIGSSLGAIGQNLLYVVEWDTKARSRPK
ncbi:hypothetical protein QUA79_03470 [Microcoleus sp. F8-D1]